MHQEAQNAAEITQPFVVLAFVAFALGKPHETFLRASHKFSESRCSINYSRRITMCINKLLFGVVALMMCLLGALAQAAAQNTSPSPTASP
jgi:hypothetical protein